jgi:hypothetical protein
VFQHVRTNPAPLPAAALVRRGGRRSFIVRDANGQALTYVYFEGEQSQRAAAKLLTRDEALRIAANIAKLPDLLGRRAPGGSVDSAVPPLAGCFLRNAGKIARPCCRQSSCRSARKAAERVDLTMNRCASPGAPPVGTAIRNRAQKPRLDRPQCVLGDVAECDRLDDRGPSPSGLLTLMRSRPPPYSYCAGNAGSGPWPIMLNFALCSSVSEA